MNLATQQSSWQEDVTDGRAYYYRTLPGDVFLTVRLDRCDGTWTWAACPPDPAIAAMASAAGYPDAHRAKLGADFWALATLEGACQAAVLREHLRTAGVHARYLAGYDLDSMTQDQLTELHDDMPARCPGCAGMPTRYP